ncbi:MAG: CapA family protein [Armatimonadetes bacterium]|nr:CapA family protein [Armatimonadota bacterium]
MRNVLRSAAESSVVRRTALFMVLAVVIIGLSPEEISKLSQCPPPEISFVAVGDVLLDRGIAKKIAKNGLEWPFAKVADVIRSADLAFCNLECPLSSTGQSLAKPIVFKADPANLKCVVDAGFDIVSNANNHALDCGRRGLVETLSVLDDAGIAHAGAGTNLEVAESPTFLEVNGLRIAFLARNMLFPEAIWYRKDAPTIAGLDESRIEDQIREAKSSADVVIVSLHWGVEYQKKPLDSQIALGRKLIDAGANLVLGHHPHCTQPVERYHGGVIAYSLGNFLFDSRNPVCMESMILKCRLSKSGVADLEIIPAKVTKWRPELSEE